MSGSLQIYFVTLMFRLQYLLIMMDASKVTPEKTEHEMRKMKWIRGSVVAVMIFIMPLDFESLANKVYLNTKSFAEARLVFCIIFMIIEVGTFTFLLGCFMKM